MDKEICSTGLWGFQGLRMAVSRLLSRTPVPLGITTHLLVRLEIFRSQKQSDEPANEIAIQDVNYLC